MNEVWSRVLLMLMCVVLTAAPILIEYLRFRRDKARGMSHKRFRTAVFSLIYAVAVTLVLYFLKEIPLIFQKIPVVPWVVNRFAAVSQAFYLTEVLAVVLLNTAIGVLFGCAQSFVRIGLKKKDLSKPNRKNNTFSLLRKTERKIVAWFHTETWFFVGQILKWFALIMTGFYSLQYALWLLPGLFEAGWIPYAWLSSLFEAGYLFPMITLLPLFEWYYFLEGIRLLETECPEFFEKITDGEEKKQDFLDQLNKDVKSTYESYYMNGTEK